MSVYLLDVCLSSVHVWSLRPSLFSRLTNRIPWFTVCGVARLRGTISHFLATGSLQMNAEAASDVDPKYQLNPRSIVSVRVCVGDVLGGGGLVCILIFVWLRGNNCVVGEWCCEVVGSCEVQLSCVMRYSTSSQPDKNLYNSTQLNFIVTRLQLNSWIAKYSSIT